MQTNRIGNLTFFYGTFYLILNVGMSSLLAQCSVFGVPLLLFIFAGNLFRLKDSLNDTSLWHTTLFSVGTMVNIAALAYAIFHR